MKLSNMLKSINESVVTVAFFTFAIVLFAVPTAFAQAYDYYDTGWGYSDSGCCEQSNDWYSIAEPTYADNDWYSIAEPYYASSPSYTYNDYTYNTYDDSLGYAYDYYPSYDYGTYYDDSYGYAYDYYQPASNYSSSYYNNVVNTNTNINNNTVTNTTIQNTTPSYPTYPSYPVYYPVSQPVVQYVQPTVTVATGYVGINQVPYTGTNDLAYVLTLLAVALGSATLIFFNKTRIASGLGTFIPAFAENTTGAAFSEDTDEEDMEESTAPTSHMLAVEKGEDGNPKLSFVASR